MTKLLKRWAIPGSAILLLTIGLVYAFWPKAVPVTLTAVKAGPMLVTIEDEGETRVKEVYTISSPLAGQVARFEGKVGDSVFAGKTVVATIRPSDPQFHDVRTHSELEAALRAAIAARDLAKAQVTSAEAAREFAESELRRAKELAAGGNVSQSALERARLEARTKVAALLEAQAALRVSEFKLQTARATLLDPASAQRKAIGDLCCFKVLAPVTGTILRIYRESEAVVAAGASLVEIGDPTDLEVVVDLLSTDAVKVSAGDEVLIEGWGGDRSLRGKVRRIEPFGFTKVSALGIEEQRVNVIVDFVDEPALWKRLGHGYRVITRIVHWRGEKVVQVPLTTLFRDVGSWAVFKVEDGRARLARIEVGHMNDRTAEVISGLEPGDIVVAHPSARIQDGIKVVDQNLTRAKKSVSR